MSTPAKYKQYAEECLEAMRAASIPEVKAALLTMAQRWTELADRTERNAPAEAISTSDVAHLPILIDQGLTALRIARIVGRTGCC
jgi:hypothetical protein